MTIYRKKSNVQVVTHLQNQDNFLFDGGCAAIKTFLLP